MEIVFNVDPETQLVTVEDSSPTISIIWDRAVQQAVINEAPGPTIASRAYAIVHTAMYDAWAAYEGTPISTQLGDQLQRPESENTEENKTEAMSYAAYRVLADLFPEQIEVFDDVMTELGFDPNNTTTDTTTAAGIGNVSAAALLEFRHDDGSNQLGDDPNGNGTPYSDISGYEPVNEPGNALFIDRWTPEFVPIDAEPGTEDRIQEFLTPHWGDVIPFGLDSGDEFRPPEPEPFLLVDGVVDLEAQTITLAEDGSVVEISPEIVGTIINPEFIAQAEEVVEFSANLTDEQKLIAEFWEDGAGTSFPPGTIMTFGQFVSARDEHTLDDDAQLFFALSNAVFDAGVATWESKEFYDYARPVRAIRDLGELGLIGEFNEDLGGYAIEAWVPDGGTETILATDFLTYQTPGSDSSPPFAEYTSGHSAFSAAGAEVLQLFTGSDEFGGFVTFEPGESRFEPGITPAETITLEWETFSEAADEAGISRLYGGIHFEDGNLNGLELGLEVGAAAFQQTQFFINGGVEAVELVFGTNEDDLFDAGVADSFDGNRDLVFAGAGEDLVDAITGEGGNRIYSGSDDDEVLAGNGDRVFGGLGDDILDASAGEGGNRLYGTVGDDEIIVGSNDRGFGGLGDDILNASTGEGGNRLYGGEGDDLFFLGQDDRVYGGEGEDRFFVTTGGGNILTGGEDADAFWIANGELPDQANTITDFELDFDVIGIGGLGVTSTDDLTFAENGNGAAITFDGSDLAIFLGIEATDLVNATFAFA